MQALLLLVVGKIVDSILAAIGKAGAAWLKSRERAAKLKDKFKKNEAKTEAYEQDQGSDSTFSDLP